jgi:hypothetical protein
MDHATADRPRVVELVAALSLAADLGPGQEMEHGLRACLIATRLAERIELDQAARDDVDCRSQSESRWRVHGWRPLCSPPDSSRRPRR